MAADSPQPERPDVIEDRIEPGSPTVENVAFVLLGVLCTFAVVLHLAGLL